MSEPVNFKHKISRQRPYGKAEPGLRASEGNLGAVIDQLESDRGRIINSAAVRRLQQKTQVFPLERNAAARSRLTHSLEVQQTGRFIVRTLYKQLGSRAAAFGLDGLETALESLVEMTCLMHDIGNPPFGHFGEYAIGEWFERHLDELFAAAVPPGQGDTGLRQRMLDDLNHFEGNAQAIRLVVSLQRLNLTYTGLHAATGQRHAGRLSAEEARLLPLRRTLRACLAGGPPDGALHAPPAGLRDGGGGRHCLLPG